MAATLPLSSPLFASESRTRMHQETAEELNNQIDDELKVRNTTPHLFISNSLSNTTE